MNESTDLELVGEIGRFYNDPLRFVEFAFPWSEEGGELKDDTGPRAWQRDTLQIIGEKIRAGATVGEAIQIATASGHGIGKSALVSMVILWAMSTREDTRGVVTANTEGQLRTKTWAELAKWHRLLICRHWFECTATAIYSRQVGHEKTWRIDAVAWSEKNTEAFAGLHNKGKRILVVFDEAGGIPNTIWEVTEGALTDEDTEAIWLAFGNPTRINVRFHECFGKLRHRWIHRQIDSRTVEGTNKLQIAKWEADYGDDSDFFRIRVRGVFPRAGTSQLIGTDLVEAAQKREAVDDRGAALVMGVDIARFGEDQSVARFRRGRDARTLPPAKWRNKDTHYSANRIAELIELYKPQAVFVDGGGVGGGVIDQLRARGYRVIEVQFGAAASEEKKFANKRMEMWQAVKEWLSIGAIDTDSELEADLSGPEFGYDKHDRLLLESKDDMKLRGLASPDDGDALAMTFAAPVARLDIAQSLHAARNAVAETDYSMFS